MPAVFHLPARLIPWLPPQPWLQVRSATRPVLRMGEREVRLRLLEAPSKLSADQLPALLNLGAIAKDAGPAIPLLVGAFLSQRIREALEARDASYLDASGHLHLVAPGVFIHLGGGRSAPNVKQPGQGTLGVHGVRAIQTLLGEQAPVSVSQLAERAALSVGQTHRVLTRLEEVGLVRTSGRGPAKRRTVRERTELLDWLQTQTSATRRERSLQVALYARRPEDLWLHSSTKLSKAGIPHALTGAAAASVFGIGPTSVPLSRVRISPEVPLSQAAEALGAEVTERGANLTLLQDTGRVGCQSATHQDGILVAPPVRIYLDARSERRGEDIAQRFREEVLGY
ncbi:hypothetical protein D7V97_13535 [Corallococcus sp. CA053C]|uniref:helix-turn-helix domain-containing protein n=1 Tax=Corallococcus sp. CA053C TaxID=2316732 RepID=UPI000EA2D7BE|nr:helix-turn-helix domain-containing protein [Corallococcus sp. CA053C]RKH10505.1 hypothetical protein D7V97_13535 [Corallococcus sp. CA053C]